MNEIFYKKILRHFEAHPAYIYPFNLANRLLTLSGFAAYPILLFIYAVQRDRRFFAFLFLPAFFFLALSQVRKMINSPRPYELYDIIPLIPRDGIGQSFPSRHVFSISLIGTLWCGVFLPVGILLLLFGVILAIIRVAAGVHFLKDVLFGALIGTICGILTLFISIL